MKNTMLFAMVSIFLVNVLVACHSKSGGLPPDNVLSLERVTCKVASKPNEYEVSLFVKNISSDPVIVECNAIVELTICGEGDQFRIGKRVNPSVSLPACYYAILPGSNIDPMSKPANNGVSFNESLFLEGVVDFSGQPKPNKMIITVTLLYSTKVDLSDIRSSLSVARLSTEVK